MRKQKVYKGYLNPPSDTTDDSIEVEDEAEDLADSAPSLPPVSDQEPIILKYRFTKNYRHPSLDTSLTKSRVKGEARALTKCLEAGVSVPQLRLVNVREGLLGLEFIEGKSVRDLLGGGAEDEEELDEAEVEEEMDNEDQLEDEDALEEYGVTQGVFLVSFFHRWLYVDCVF